MKNIVFIKLGGSIITDKEKPLTIRPSVIKSLAEQLRITIQENQDTHFIIGNGAGSFGHYFVHKYNLRNGIHTPNQLTGFCEETQADKDLNRIIVNALLKKKINAASIHPSSILTSSNGKVKKVFLDSLLGFLALNITPVLYGAIVYDDKNGSNIFSTEDIFLHLIKALNEKFIITKVIYLTSVDGFLDNKNETISLVSRDNYNKLKKNFFKIHGYDVTGGMQQKIESCLKLAELGIVSHIVNGGKKNSLLKIFRGIEIGTRVI